MKNYNISIGDLWRFFESKREGKTLQSVNYWRSGQKLPSGETLMMIVEFLTGLNVPRKDWLRLKSAHRYDLLLSDSRLSYLSENEREKIAEHARDMILHG